GFRCCGIARVFTNSSFPSQCRTALRSRSLNGGSNVRCSRADLATPCVATFGDGEPTAPRQTAGAHRLRAPWIGIQAHAPPRPLPLLVQRVVSQTFLRSTSGCGCRKERSMKPLRVAFATCAILFGSAFLCPSRAPAQLDHLLCYRMSDPLQVSSALDMMADM